MSPILAQSPAAWDKPKVKRLERGLGMAYVSTGTGSPVVLVHGSLCDYRYWAPQLESLADHHHLIAPSLSHHYPKLPSAARRKFGWRCHVDQLVAFLARLDGQRPHLVGHSRGACVAFQLAAQYPRLLRSLTLVDPGGPLEGEPEDPEAPERERMLRRRAVSLIEAGEVDEGLRVFIDSVSRPGLWDRSTPNFRRMAQDNADTLGPQMADPLPAYEHADARLVDCPVLLVQGALSPRPYRRNADVLREWLPHAQSATIAGASHGMSFTHARAFNQVLLHFIDECEAAELGGVAA